MTSNPDETEESSSSDRVVTVQYNGALVKVCENRASFEQWLETTDWSEDQLKLLDARVRPEQ